MNPKESPGKTAILDNGAAFFLALEVLVEYSIMNLNF